jgi:phosphoglucosamine mutase
VLINVPVSGSAAGVMVDAKIAAARAEVEAQLGTRGRLLLRASGTEPLIRVMVEGEDAAAIRAAAEYLAGCVRAVCA